MDTNNQQTDAQLEEAEAQHLIEQYNALKRLKENKDFQKVILEGYLEAKALDSVSLLAVPAIKQRGERPEVMEDLVAISNLQYYFRMLENLGSIAEDDLAAAEGPEGDDSLDISVV